MIYCKREGNNRHAVMVANIQNAFDSVAGCGCLADRCAGFVTRLRPNDELPPRPKLLASHFIYIYMSCVQTRACLALDLLPRYTSLLRFIPPCCLLLLTMALSTAAGAPLGSAVSDNANSNNKRSQNDSKPAAAAAETADYAPFSMHNMLNE